MAKLMTIPDWNWNRKLPSDVWYKISFDDYPDWDIAGYEGNYPFPPTVYLEIKKGTDRSSHDLAVETDDWSEGHFYYRDWTNSGLPFVDDGEVYKSRFWFQLEKDAVEFQKRYGGDIQ